jgi:glycosyltransferase involved in cell wall biosynthesis
MDDSTTQPSGSHGSGQVLFLHTNYPAQFRFLVKAYRARGWSVWFASHTTKNPPLPDITHLPLRQAAAKGSKLDQLQLRAQLAFGDLLAAKRRGGLQPERIYVHTGWGLGPFLRDLFPRATLIAYSEWWFNLHAHDFNFDPTNPEVGHTLDTRLAMVLRNQGFALELLQADAVVAPTQWQRSQLPPPLRQRCHVIFDGIDPTMFRPGVGDLSPIKTLAGLDPGTPLLTYATRGLEPYRGFPEFARAAEALLTADPRWHVAIAGKDAPTYFRGHGKQSQGFGARAMARFEALGVAERVHMLGTLPLLSYRNLLQRSTLHCYFTRPYVLSWSLLEAALCGCRLLSSTTPPVQEFLHRDPGSTLVDHTSEQLGEQLIDAAHRAVSESTHSAKDRLLERGAILQRVAAPLCVKRHLKLADQLSKREED